MSKPDRDGSYLVRELVRCGKAQCRCVDGPEHSVAVVALCATLRRQAPSFTIIAIYVPTVPTWHYAEFGELWRTRT